MIKSDYFNNEATDDRKNWLSLDWEDAQDFKGTTIYSRADVTVLRCFLQTTAGSYDS